MGRATLHSTPAPFGPKPAADGAPMSVSPGDAAPPSSGVERRAIKPNAVPVTTTDDTTSSIAEGSAQPASTSSEASAQAAARAPNAGPQISATTDEFVQRGAQEGNTTPSIPEVPAPQASTSSETSSQADSPALGAPVAWRDTGLARAFPTDAHADSVSDRTAQGGELTNNARMPATIFLILALGLAMVGILCRVTIKNAAARRARNIVDHAEPDKIDDQSIDEYNNPEFYRKLRQGHALKNP